MGFFVNINLEFFDRKKKIDFVTFFIIAYLIEKEFCEAMIRLSRFAESPFWEWKLYSKFQHPSFFWFQGLTFVLSV